MFAVIFEVKPKPERRMDYLKEAGFLRPELQKIDGFMANERYGDLARDGYVLSLSLWRNEKALLRWRTLARHHQAQEAGRSGIFADYHLRVEEIVADSGRPASESARQDASTRPRRALPNTGFSASRIEEGAQAASAAEIAARLGAPDEDKTGLLASSAFRHLLRSSEFLLLTSWERRADAENWLAASAAGSVRHRVVRIIRDYGMFDRREAPQYTREPTRVFYQKA
jgi:heme-degrading monooxygenase HmoA